MRPRAILTWTLMIVLCIGTASFGTSLDTDVDELIALWYEDPSDASEVVESLKAHRTPAVIRLVELLDQTALDTAESAAKALQQLLDGEPLDVLLRDALAADDTGVRAGAARALGILHSDGLVTELLTHVQNERNIGAIQFLTLARNIRSTLVPGNLTLDDVTRLLGQSLSDPDAQVRRAAALALSKLLGQDATDQVLIDTLRLHPAPIGEVAAWALSAVGIEEVDTLLRWLEVIDALGVPDDAVPAVASLLTHPVLQVAWRAAELLPDSQASVGLESLLSGALDLPSAAVRWAAAEALAEMALGYAPAVGTRLGIADVNTDLVLPALTQALSDSSVDVRRAALKALERLTESALPEARAILVELAEREAEPEDVQAMALRLLARSEAYDLTPAQRERVGMYEKKAVFERGTEGYHTFRIPSVLVSGSGTVLVFAEGRKNSQSDTGDIDLVLKRSFDNGLTWEPLQIVWDSGPNTSGNPVPVLDRETGRIWLFMTHNLGTDTQAQIQNGTSQGVRTIWVTYSDDDGATWSEPENLFEAVQDPGTRWDATGPATGIQLEHGPNRGRLVVPAIGRIIYSDDHGATWHQGRRIAGTSESQVVELPDGRLLRNDRAVARSVPNRRPLAYSDDQGLTWGPLWYARELVTTYAQGSTIAHHDPTSPGRSVLLFSNPATAANVDQVTGAKGHGARVNMTVRASYDMGKSWTPGKSIHRGPSGYSGLATLADGSVALLFEGGRSHTYEGIYFYRFTLDWLEDER